jgi:hypothetical protein
MSLDSNLQVGDLLHFVDENVKEIPDLTGVGPGWPLGVAHGYCEGRLAIILHISLRRGESEIQKLCATYYRSAEIVKSRLADGWSDEAKLPTDNMLHRHGEQSVLVRIVEFPDERKEGRQLMVPSLVRLRSLDSCLRVSAQIREPTFPLADETGLCVADRELQITKVRGRIRSAIPDSNAIDEVIEGGSKIMNTVPRNQTPTFKRGRFIDINANGVAATVQVAFLGENIRLSINPRLQFGLESVEMFLGSTYFEEAASEFRTDHAVYGTNRSTGASS